MSEKLLLILTCFIIFTLTVWGFDAEGGRYLQQLGLIAAGILFGNLITIAEDINDENK